MYSFQSTSNIDFNSNDADLAIAQVLNFMRACRKPESRQGAFEQFHNKSKHSNKHEGRINSPLAPCKFPEINLEEALKVAKAIEEKFAENPTKADALVICGGDGP